jgi:hypothetical protein
MRRVLTLLVMVAVVTIAATSQNMYLGPSVVFKGGTNAGNIPEGMKTAANFNGIPDIGLTFKWMFDKESSLGLLFDAEYATYSFRMRPEDENFANDDNTLIYKPSYISFSPGLYFSGVTLNVAFGFPSGMNVQSVSGNENTFFEVTQQDLNAPSVEIRLGGMIRAIKSDLGEFNVVLRAGYMVTGMYQPDYFTNNGFDDSYNPNIVSAGIGINYLFNLANL